MTMVISLGLERFYYGEPDELRADAARALVEQDLTTLVREVVAPERSMLDQARVFEARRERDGVVGRWLEPGEAKPLLDAVGKIYAKHDTFASFSWDETDRLGIEVPSLALVADGAKKAAFATRVSLPGVDTPVGAGDLSSCWLGSRRHGQLTIARAYLRLAQKYRLIVHSA